MKIDLASVGMQSMGGKLQSGLDLEKVNAIDIKPYQDKISRAEADSDLCLSQMSAWAGLLQSLEALHDYSKQISMYAGERKQALVSDARLIDVILDGATNVPGFLISELSMATSTTTYLGHFGADHVFDSGGDVYIIQGEPGWVDINRVVQEYFFQDSDGRIEEIKDILVHDSSIVGEKLKLEGVSFSKEKKKGKESDEYIILIMINGETYRSNIEVPYDGFLPEGSEVPFVGKKMNFTMITDNIMADSKDFSKYLHRRIQDPKVLSSDTDYITVNTDILKEAIAGFPLSKPGKFYMQPFLLLEGDNLILTQLGEYRCSLAMASVGYLDDKLYFHDENGDSLIIKLKDSIGSLLNDPGSLVDLLNRGFGMDKSSANIVGSVAVEDGDSVDDLARKFNETDLVYAYLLKVDDQRYSVVVKSMLEGKGGHWLAFKDVDLPQLRFVMGDNATLVVDDNLIISNSNEIELFKQEVTVRLKGNLSKSDPAINVKITDDTGSIDQDIEELVFIYNHVRDKMLAQLPKSRPGGMGEGSALISREPAFNRVDIALNDALNFRKNEFALRDCGLEKNAYGKLTIVNKDIQKLFHNNDRRMEFFYDFVDFFSKVLEGLVAQDGWIKREIESLQSRHKRFDKDLDQAKESAEKQKKQLAGRYAKLEANAMMANNMIAMLDHQMQSFYGKQ